jgi:hypothetical protein
MAYKGSQPFKITLEAGADLSAKQYYFVKLDATGKAVVCSGVTDKPVGVLQNDPTSGQAAEVVVAGLTKVSTNAALAIADLIGTSAMMVRRPLMSLALTQQNMLSALFSSLQVAQMKSHRH